MPLNGITSICVKRTFNNKPREPYVLDQLLVTGNVGVACTAPLHTVDVAGSLRATNVYSGGNLLSLSDARFKANLATLSSPLAKLGALTGYTYERTTPDAGPEREAGVLAQDVLSVLPESVREDASGTLSVSYAGITALCVESIKALEARVKALEETAGQTAAAKA